MKRLRDNPVSVLALVVVVLALGYIGLQVRSANNNAGHATTAVADLADVLNRRSPVLTYLSCSNARDIAVDHTEKAYLLGLVDRAPELPFLRADYERAVEIRDKTNLPEADGGCGGLPTGG